MWYTGLMVPKVPWFDHLWLFFVGIPQIAWLYSQTSHLARSEVGNQGGSGNNWSWDAGTSIRRFSAKAWKLRSRKWTPPAWHYLSFIICNSNGMQLRKFFCNKIAFSLKNKWVLIISKTSGSRRSPCIFKQGSWQQLSFSLRSIPRERKLLDWHCSDVRENIYDDRIRLSAAINAFNSLSHSDKKKKIPRVYVENF